MTLDEYFDIVTCFLSESYKPTILAATAARRKYADRAYEDAPGYKYGDYVLYHESLIDGILYLREATKDLIISARLYEIEDDYDTDTDFYTGRIEKAHKALEYAQGSIRNIVERYEGK